MDKDGGWSGDSGVWGQVRKEGGHAPCLYLFTLCLLHGLAHAIYCHVPYIPYTLLYYYISLSIHMYVAACPFHYYTYMHAFACPFDITYFSLYYTHNDITLTYICMQHFVYTYRFGYSSICMCTAVVLRADGLWFGLFGRCHLPNVCVSTVSIRFYDVVDLVLHLLYV